MSTEIKAPTFPESVADGTIATWHKQPGEAIARDELIVDIETDKVVLEVLASDDGVIEAILKQEGDIVLSGEVIGKFIAGGKASVSAKAEASKETTVVSTTLDSLIMSPAAKKLVEENSLNPSDINTTGKDGRLTKEDVVNHLSEKQQTAPPAVQTAKASPSLETPIDTPTGVRAEKRVPMTRLRASIARRLLDASQNTAMLTTFNEVNMRPLMDLRKQYKEIFEKKHDGTKLGFMSLFVKASAEALKRFPAVNASIDGDEIVYHGYQDIGVAVSSEKGLVVPVLRDSDTMSLATIERSIKSYGAKAQAGKLTIEEMTGGTFTISNGGVFGSLMSTPILNPPQTAILGMHKIQERPMAVNGQVVILPMMYLALSYDHRMIDGKEAVQFLVSIKEMIEDPARILLEI
ncbi:MAG: 2-oxoglutarate dehydrogenase E2 component (dihydrolipoamide succinyltransferase) [Oleiphilaceae bacterium]|jgi:2-oxoglutarate dehydrogenase E2 component (dihydrolipoamide succinyltransferase)